MINHPFLTIPTHIEIRDYLRHSRHTTWGNSPDTPVGIFQDWIKLNFFQSDFTWLELDLSSRLKHGFEDKAILIIDIDIYFVNDEVFSEINLSSPMAKMLFGSGIIYRPD